MKSLAHKRLSRTVWLSEKIVIVLKLLKLFSLELTCLVDIRVMLLPQLCISLIGCPPNSWILRLHYRLSRHTYPYQRCWCFLGFLSVLLSSISIKTSTQNWILVQSTAYFWDMPYTKRDIDATIKFIGVPTWLWMSLFWSPSHSFLLPYPILLFRGRPMMKRQIG